MGVVLRLKVNNISHQILYSSPVLKTAVLEIKVYIRGNRGHEFNWWIICIYLLKKLLNWIRSTLKSSIRQNIFDPNAIRTRSVKPMFYYAILLYINASLAPVARCLQPHFGFNKTIWQRWDSNPRLSDLELANPLDFRSNALTNILSC